MRQEVLAIVALVAGSSCSLLFSEEKSSDEATFEVCEGLTRAYYRGDPILSQPNRFPRVDLRQGTLTFWVRALESLQDDALLVYLTGMSVTALQEGGVSVTFGSGAPFVLSGPSWEPDVDHFVSLRWDTLHPISGYEPRTPQVEIRIDAKTQDFEQKIALDPPSTEEDDYLVFGDLAGHVHVDQVVIYDRPIFVDVRIENESDLKLMSEDKGSSSIISGGGFDVLLATVSPTDAACDNYVPEAWAFPDTERTGGDLRIGATPAGGTGFFNPALAEDQVFAGGGFRLPEGSTAMVTAGVSQSKNYVLELLTHSQMDLNGYPEVLIKSEAADGIDLSYTGDAATRANPQRSIVSFQVGSADTQIAITVTARDGPLMLHSLSIEVNALSDPGFERTQIGDEAPWVHETKEPASPVVFLEVEPYAGLRSACLDSDQTPDVLRQAAANMDDHKLYLFGAQIKWGERDIPSAHIGNGSLFATGVPYGARSKAGALSRDIRSWQSVATVGRRLLDDMSLEGLNNNNDIIRFGTGNKGGGTDFCLDSAYTVGLQTIPGELLTP